MVGEKLTMPGFNVTHVIFEGHDDLRYPPKGTRVEVDQNVNWMRWRTADGVEGNILTPHFLRMHLRPLTDAERMEEIHAHG